MEFRKLFSFHGRIGRGAFWGLSTAVTLVELGGSAGLGAVASTVNEGSTTYTLLALLTLVLVPAGFVIQLATNVKRWHDRGKSGWWVFINAIPIIGLLWSLIEQGFLAGTNGYNQHGAPGSGSPFGGGSGVSHGTTLARMRS